MSEPTRDDPQPRYVLPPPPRPALPVVGTDAWFAVRRIYCVARNYAAHAREMGADPAREPPFFFAKPADALRLPAADELPYPSLSNDVQHEIELVVAVGHGGRDIAAARALEHVFGYAVGIDVTRRDLQREAKQRGRPWEAAKAFDASAPCSPIVAVGDRLVHPDRGRIWLEVNHELRQQGDLSQMIWSVPEALAHLSRLFALEPGDLLFTGTPAGVGAIVPGDRLHGGVEGVGEIRLRVVSG